jgi:hypothetical protein
MLSEAYINIKLLIKMSNYIKLHLNYNKNIKYLAKYLF